MVETKTRSQRRMERKQAVVLLVLVLVVSLASFTLGVIVGRRGAERDLAQRYAEPRQILVAEVPAAVPPPQDGIRQKIEESEELTFYDNLSRGESAPLGSGINRPPAEDVIEETVSTPAPSQPETVSPVAETIADPQRPVTAKKTPVAAPPVEKLEPQTVESTSLPAAVPAGTYSVQVGSFSSRVDADRLKKDLLTKGYAVFVAEADLGAKGVWYRVRLGPYSDAEMAKKALQIADLKDKIKGFVSRI